METGTWSHKGAIFRFRFGSFYFQGGTAVSNYCPAPNMQSLVEHDDSGRHARQGHKKNKKLGHRLVELANFKEAMGK